MKIILASKSPRRRELLELMGIKNYEVMVSNIDEEIDDNLKIKDKVKKLSYKKAKIVFDKTKGDIIVIGADTIVVKDGNIYGKPKDEEDAKNMLRKFMDSKVDVMTAVTVLIEKKSKVSKKIDLDESEVHIKNMSNKDIKNWLDTGEYLDKAGAFAVQSTFCINIKKINGDYNSIVGLPICKLYEMIKEYL